MTQRCRTPTAFGQQGLAAFGRHGRTPAAFGQQGLAAFGRRGRTPAAFGQRCPAAFGQQGEARTKCLCGDSALGWATFLDKMFMATG